jgi:hypothetical protein
MACSALRSYEDLLGLTESGDDGRARRIAATDASRRVPSSSANGSAEMHALRAASRTL